MQLKRAKWFGIAAIGALTGILACSSAGTVVTSEGFGGSGKVGPVGTASSSAPVEEPRCPAEPPAVGSSCVDRGVRCTFGPDTREYCVEKYECEGGEWSDITGACQVQCPKSFDEIAPGTACGDSEMACSYEQGTCGCVYAGSKPDAGSADAATSDAAADAGDGGDGGKKDGGIVRPLVPGVWKCVAPPTDPACPSARPRVVDACVKPVKCDYGTCELGQDLSYACTGGPAGVWQPSFDPPSCP